MSLLINIYKLCIFFNIDDILLLNYCPLTNYLPLEEEVSPPPYPAQQVNLPAQPGYSAQPGYPQQPYNAQPGYPGPQPFTGQPMGYPQPYPVTQQSSTTVVMQVRFLNNIV